jgi:hypothetical protein
MFARNISIHLKSNMLSDYTRAFEKDVLPLLRKQNGFKDEITFAGPGGVDVTAISLWDNKNDADNYNAHTYQQVLKTLARFIDGTPKVQTFDIVNSTFHNIRSRSGNRLTSVRSSSGEAVKSAFSVCKLARLLLADLPKMLV